MSSISFGWTYLLVGVLSLGAAKALCGQESAAAKGNSGSAPTSAYLLSAGDGIEVKFDYNPELDEKVVIRPDGLISLTMVGEINAGNLTVAELANSISARYARILAHPQAVVMVREFASQRIYVGGEVNGPGVFGLRGPLSAMQAIVQAGGAKPSGRLGQVLLIRNGGGTGATVSQFDIGRILKGRAPDVWLQPFDVVYVPRTPIAKAGLFVQQYINDIVPKSIFFPYNLNNVFTVKP